MWWRLWILIIKEFQIIWRDRKSRFVLIIPPIVQTILFGFAATMEVKDVPLAFYSADKGRYGWELSERLRQSSSFHNMIYLQREEDMQRVIDERRALLAVALPEDFSQSLHKGLPVAVQVLLDGRKSNSAQLALNYLQAIVQEMEVELALPASEVEVITRSWFNPNKDYHWFTVPGLIGIIMALEVLLLTGLSVARERELGTFEQLLVSPLSAREIIIGKTVPALLIGMAEGTLVVLLAVFLFGIPFLGSLPLLYLSMLLYALAMTGIGLFVSALVQTQQQAMLGTFMVMMPVILLSGFMTPYENMPNWLQLVTAWNPLHYFLIVVKGIFLKDVSLLIVLHEELCLLGVSLVTLGTSVWFFRRRLA